MSDLIPEIDATRQPVVFIREGEVFANSRTVSTAFDKHHRDVLRAIDTLVQQEPSLGLRSFAQTPYLEPTTGQEYRSFDMNRDGFTLLAMGFTGAKALKWKLRYIEAFNALEAEVRSRLSADLNDPVALRNLLLAHTEREIAMQAQITEMKPTVDAFDRIAGADGSLIVRETAKALQIREKDLISYLMQNGWAYRRNGSGHLLGYQAKTAAGLIVHKVTTISQPDGSERVTEQMRITPKGLTKLAKIFGSGEAPDLPFGPS
ncbi:MAG TPA: phage regulatory protein/antirepressor Ant [Geminicoccus sp.]|uniref:phage regulatory protein/antirepressor Ant n=1 Tax=Geminicoccus sp. TaxID=2024832 RepID=UPI002B625911|nr:phage regulatory protein/antirepressor Ant [Geminicoccus sp.]HWL70433.1 phage regulatory protein/antirepressor Ant [Geminicoccus sp.]